MQTRGGTLDQGNGSGRKETTGRSTTQHQNDGNDGTMGQTALEANMNIITRSTENIILELRWYPTCISCTTSVHM